MDMNSMDGIIINAKILDVNLGYDDVGGSVGQNFTLKIRTTAHTSDLTFNPVIIPKLLKYFEVNNLNELKGEYCQVLSKSHLHVGDFLSDIKGIRPILSRGNDEWIEYKGDIYYGSEMITNNESMVRSIDILLDNVEHRSKEQIVSNLEGWKAALKIGVIGDD